MLPLDAAAAAAETVFAAQAWLVEEFAGAMPARAELRDTLQLAHYNGAKFLPPEWRQARDRSKIRQETPRAALIDAWVTVLAMKKERNKATGGLVAAAGSAAGGAAAGAGGSSRSSASASERKSSQVCYSTTVSGCL